MVRNIQIAIEGNLLWPQGAIKYGNLTVDDAGRIAAIREGPLVGEAGFNARVVRLPSGYIAVPGYIDVQINGAFGEEVKSDPTAAATLRAKLPRFGITSFLPTVTSLPIQTYAPVLAQIRDHMGGDGSNVLGVHLEGPFLNKAMRGGHPEDYLTVPESVADSEFGHDPIVRMVTLAPELYGALPLIESLASRGIVVGVGHSTADGEVLVEARRRGLQWGTHIFNAMNPMKSREPGLAGYLLTESGMAAGLIADGIHVHPRMVALAYRLKGREQTILMTDSSAVTGMSPGTYKFRNRQITTDGESARLPDGTLVGSVLTLDKAVRNMMQFTGCTIADAVHMASTGPARLLGLEEKKGSLAPGADADIVVLDEAFDVRSTIIGGRIAYQSDGARGGDDMNT